jgi:hypothetical protein
MRLASSLAAPSTFNPTRRETMLKVSTIRNGLLVSLRTSLAGNVHYEAQVIENDHIDPITGARRARWETERVIADPAEHEAAVKARGKARSLIVSVCTASAFGLLCPEGDADKLDEAMREARLIAEEFNANAKLTRVSVNILVGRIAADDVEAVRAINSEVRDLLSQMERGLRNADAGTIREAANKAKALSTMLSPQAAKRAQVAIEAARIAARKIVKAGESAALEIDTAAIEAVRTGRLAFLDLDDDGQPIEAPVSRAAAVDFEAPAEREIAPALANDLDFDAPVTPVIPAVRPSLFADIDVA